jgi:hypothetical protein
LGRGGSPGRQKGSCNGAQSSGDLQKHPDPYVGKAFLQKCRRRSGRRGDYRNQGGADGVTDIDAEQQRQHRRDDHTSTESGQSAQKAGRRTKQNKHQAEFERVQIVSLANSKYALRQHLKIQDAQKPGK